MSWEVCGHSNRPIIPYNPRQRILQAMEVQGIGIEPQYAQDIFEPFKRLHPLSNYEGSGIGLAICRKIVERHGGKIWVESELGKGAHFRFTIGHRRKVYGSSKKKDRQLSFSLKMSQMPRS